MILIEDKANKEGSHTLKNAYWKSQGIEVIRHPLPVGDYILIDEKVAEMLERKEKRGIPPKKMDFLGTYKVCVDSKKDIQELCGNICSKAHARFRDECLLAQNNGIQLYVLVENESFLLKNGDESPFISELNELSKWVNPRLWIRRNGKQVYPKATRGRSLMLSCIKMEKEYGVRFLFCRPQDAGAKIIELLGGNQDG